MSETLTASFFAGNRQTLKKLNKDQAPIVLTANGLLQRSIDITFDFHQDRNFWYLTGIDEPDALLVIDSAKEYIILSQDYIHRARFDGALTKEQISKISGVKEVLDYEEGWNRLESRVKKNKQVATLSAPPAYIEWHGFYSNPAKASLINRLKDINSDLEVLDLKQHFVTMRSIKQPAELKMMERAIDITERAIKTITKQTWTQKTTEIDLALEIDYLFKKLGADGVAFDTIVQIDGSSAVIHNHPGSVTLSKNGSVLFDVGAGYNHYAADISRVFKTGKPSNRYMQVYDATREALETALSMLKPGVIYKQFEQDMEKVVGEKLIELGLIKDLERKSVRTYFPTFTAHPLGLDPHDVFDIDMSLKENMVFAVEPGIYIPEEGIGIRIEENVLITKNGIKLMSNALSREPLSLKIK